MAIFELLLILLKALILSTLYSFSILIILIISNKLSSKKWKEKILKKRFLFYIKTHVLVGISLFIISFNYSQETGLGDHNSIPIGFNQTIHNEEFQWTYFYPNLEKTESNKDELIILKYNIKNNILCAEISHEFSNSPNYDFITYELQTKKIKKHTSINEYEKYAKKNFLPSKSEFINFEKHYKEYLEKRPFWKKWLIP